MKQGDMQAGPRFADLMGSGGGGPLAPSGPGDPDAGMGMSPPQTPNMQAALQANMTNPVHAAKAAADLSKQRLLALAQQIKQAREAI